MQEPQQTSSLRIRIWVILHFRVLYCSRGGCIHEFLYKSLGNEVELELGL